MMLKIDLAAELNRLYVARNRSDFATQSVAVAQALFPSAVIVWHEVQAGRSPQSQHQCDDGRATIALHKAWKKFAMQSPVIRYYLAGGKDPVIPTQDLVADRVLRSSELYEECWRPFGVKYQTGLRLWDEKQVFGVSIKRDRKFSDRDVASLRSIHPHFKRAWQLASTEPALGFVPALDELTRRENEILGWIAGGKRDSEIASILGIAGRTASKHVENILGKLGVETRTAAARIAFERRRANVRMGLSANG